MCVGNLKLISEERKEEKKKERKEGTKEGSKDSKDTDLINKH
jgi:hypothetical protein